jgi:putative transposase
MGRSLRIAEAGLVYHVLNRGKGRRTLFYKDEDYRAFEHVLEEAQARLPTRLFAYCLMPNHWHMVLWPEQPEQLSRFLGWLTLTHAQRWHAHYHNVGTGHLYQGGSSPSRCRRTTTCWPSAATWSVTLGVPAW